MAAPARMHIPDSLLSLAVSAICWALTVGFLSVVLLHASRSFHERKVPLMGIMAAFIFAAQMLNFPIALGTSGHLLGAALVSFMLGPSAAMLVMTAVIVVQGLLFQDGGLLAMGANILNMGIIPVLVSYALYRPFIKRSQRFRLVAAGASAWLSVISAALLTSLELWLSGSARLDLVLPAMLGIHALIGIPEALISVSALGFISRLGLDRIDSQEVSSTTSIGVVVGIVIALAVAVLSPLASTDPDGFERVAQTLGILPATQMPPLEVFPDYTIPFLGEASTSTILAGMLGVLIMGGLFLLIWKLIQRHRDDDVVVPNWNQYRLGGSLMHHVEARVKVVVTVVFILSNVLLPDTGWGGFILSYLFILLANGLSGLGPFYTSRRAFIVLPFALAAVTVIFSIPGKEIISWHFGSTTLGVTDTGVVHFISIILRAWISVQAAILLVATTRFPDLIHALEHLRIPRILVSVIAFLYRYLFVLSDEVLRLMRARQSRSASVSGHRSGGTVFWRARVAGHMVGQLFMRSYDRSDRVYQAMLARGYTGQIRTLSAHKLKAREWFFLTTSLIGLMLVQVIGRN